MITQQRPSGDPNTEDAIPDTDPVARLRLQLDELQTYIRQQWAARTDRALLGLRRLILLASAGVVAIVAAGAWIVTSVVLFLLGASDGLSILLAGRLWLANLIVGAGAIVLLAIGTMVAWAGWAAASKRRTRTKYEHRQREQRRRFGHTARDRASHS